MKSHRLSLPYSQPYKSPVRTNSRAPGEALIWAVSLGIGAGLSFPSRISRLRAHSSPLMIAFFPSPRFALSFSKSWTLWSYVMWSLVFLHSASNSGIHLCLPPKGAFLKCSLSWPSNYVLQFTLPISANDPFIYPELKPKLGIISNAFESSLLNPSGILLPPTSPLSAF